MPRRVFSKRLQQLRMEKGASQSEMAEALGLTRNYIFNIEADYAYPSMTNFFAICEYLDVTPAEFFNIEPQTTGKEDDLLYYAKGLDDQQMDQLINLAKKLKSR